MGERHKKKQGYMGADPRRKQEYKGGRHKEKQGYMGERHKRKKDLWGKISIHQSRSRSPRVFWSAPTDQKTRERDCPHIRLNLPAEEYTCFLALNLLSSKVYRS